MRVIQSDVATTVYIGAKLTGATRSALDELRDFISAMDRHFEVLPFAYDFDAYAPLGDPADVYATDIGKLAVADLAIFLIRKDVSEGRGMEAMYRALTRGKGNTNMLYLIPKDGGYSPFLDGFMDEFQIPAIRYDGVSFPGGLYHSVFSEPWISLPEVRVKEVPSLWLPTS